MSAVRAELTRRPGLSDTEFAFALAAAFLLAVNLTLAAAGHASWSQEVSQPGDLAAETVTVRELAPELSPAEARRQVLLLRARTRLLPAPVVPPGHDLTEPGR
jgi:hypothetical protein